MVQTEILDFLQTGAFYRLPSGEFCIFRGEWSPSSEGDIGFQQFFDSELSQFTAKRQILRLPKQELRAALSEFVANSSSSEFSRSSFRGPDRAGFTKSFDLILEKIHQNEIQKALPIVSSRSAQCPSLSDRARWIINLMNQPQRLHLYGCWNSEFGILGATPEILFHLKDTVVSTMAVAGTLPKSEVQRRQPLLQDEKEMSEHLWVVEDLKTQLSKWGSVQVSKTNEVELPHLFHLMTDLRVEISKPILASELCKLLHPTPALGVSPRSYGFQWLKELPDQADRGLFGAPLVFRISEQERIGLVAIRNVQWFSSLKRTETLVSSGCGLVKDSQIEREWQELMAKQDSTFQTLGIT